MSVNVYSEKTNGLIKISGANSYEELQNAPNIQQNGNDVIINESVTINNTGNVDIKDGGTLKVSNLDVDKISLNDKDLQDTLSEIDEINSVIDLNNNSEFIIQDDDSNVILKADNTGLMTTEIQLNDLSISEGKVAQAIITLDEKIGEKPVDEQITEAIDNIKGTVSDNYNTLGKIEEKLTLVETTVSNISTDNDNEFIIQDKENNVIFQVGENNVITTDIELTKIQSYKDKSVANILDTQKGQIEELQEKVGEDPVEKQIGDAVSAIKGDVKTYDTLGKLEDKFDILDTAIDTKNNSEFIIQDKEDNTILKVDSDGLITTKIYLNDLTQDVATSIKANEGDIEINQRNIEKNAEAIDILNGDVTTEGSVKYQVEQVSNEVKKLVAEAPEAYDTFKEIAEYIEKHGGEAGEMAEAINALENKFSELYQNDNEFIIQDKSQNIILQVNKDGLLTTTVTVDNLDIENGDVGKAIHALDEKIGVKTVDDQINDAINLIKGDVETYDTLGKVEDEIVNLQEKVGPDSVNTQIETAINNLKGANISADYDTLEDIEKQIKEHQNLYSVIEPDNDNSSFTVQDKSNNIILQVNKDGLTTTGIYLNTLNDSSDNEVGSRIRQNDQSITTLNGDKDVINSVDYKIEQARIALVNGAETGYQTLGEIQQSIGGVVEDAIQNLVDEANDGYQTLGDIEKTVGDIKGSLEDTINNLKQDIIDGTLAGGGDEPNPDYSITQIRSDLNEHISTATGQFTKLNNHITDDTRHLVESQQTTLSSINGTSDTDGFYISDRTGNFGFGVDKNYTYVTNMLVAGQYDLKDHLEKQVLCSQEQYEQLGATVKTDNKIYFITH